MNTPEQPTPISWADFEKVDMRTGTIVAVEPFPQARKPAYKLTIDFGELGLKRSSAQLTTLYSPDTLVGAGVCCRRWYGHPTATRTHHTKRPSDWITSSNPVRL